jgi:monofunctional biosynthetic peptidoglycan transglycosylase
MEHSAMKRIIVYSSLIVMAILVFIPKARAKEANKSMGLQERLIFDFKNTDDIEYWRIVNDGVMGGLSKSEFVFSNSNTAIFKGIVSLENNGGFASIRTIPRAYELDGYHGILLRVKGDGKNYQFRLRTDDRFDGISYRYQFETKFNTWMTIEIPFRECVPVFRGRILEDVKPIPPEEIQQIGFLISNKKAEKFQLEIDWIKAYIK